VIHKERFFLHCRLFTHVFIWLNWYVFLASAIWSQGGFYDCPSCTEQRKSCSPPMMRSSVFRSALGKLSCVYFTETCLFLVYFGCLSLLSCVYLCYAEVRCKLFAVVSPWCDLWVKRSPLIKKKKCQNEWAGEQIHALTLYMSFNKNSRETWQRAAQLALYKWQSRCGLAKPSPREANHNRSLLNNSNYCSYEGNERRSYGYWQRRE
jgi:hypothetical protein